MELDEEEEEELAGCFEKKSYSAVNAKESGGSKDWSRSRLLVPSKDE